MGLKEIIAAVQSKDNEALKRMLPIDQDLQTLQFSEPYCKRCNDSGWLPAENKEANGTTYEFVKPCPCVQKRRMMRIAELSGLGTTMDVMTLSTFIAEKPHQIAMLDKVTEWLTTTDKWLYISGQPGSGKTHICTAACVELLDKGVAVRYMLWTDTAERIKAERMDAEAMDELLEPLKTVPVLYVDDLFKNEARDGKLSPTPASEKLAFEIINARYNRKLRTIISSEWGIELLINTDQATFSRVYQMCGKYQLHIAPDKAKNWRLT